MYWFGSNSQIIKQLHKMAKFGVVGVYVFIQDLTITWLLVKVVNLGVFYGVTISYILAIAVHFLLNYYFIFSHKNNNVFLTILKYLLTVSLNYILTILTVKFSLIYVSQSIIVAKIIAILITFVTSYLFLNKFVFKKKFK